MLCRALRSPHLLQDDCLSIGVGVTLNAQWRKKVGQPTLCQVTGKLSASAHTCRATSAFSAARVSPSMPGIQARSRISVHAR